MFLKIVLKPVFIIGIIAVVMIGTIIVHASEEIIEDGINSLEIYEDENYTTTLTGDAPASTGLDTGTYIVGLDPESLY